MRINGKEVSVLSIDKLKSWLNGEYVSPQDFKDSVKEAIKRIGILEKIYKADIEYYMKEVERLQEKRSQDSFKIIELETALKIKDQSGFAEGNAYCENCHYETGWLGMKDLIFKLSIEGGYIVSDKAEGYYSKCPNCESSNLSLEDF